MTPTFTLSIDDRRALWALTERHLRSPSFPAVLLVRAALRRGAQLVRISSTRRALRVVDDGAPLDADIDDLDAILASPTVARLHDVERERGTELLVAVATATSATVVGRRWRLTAQRGAVTRRAPDFSDENVVEIVRDPSLRTAERQELRAWLPSPAARVTLNGRALGAPMRLPETIALARSVTTSDGKGVIGLALDDAVSRVTYLARGVWIAHEQYRPRGLPVHAVWNSTTLPPTPEASLPDGRRRIAAATDQLIGLLGATFASTPAPIRRQVRTRLLRSDVVPAALRSAPLFDSEDGAFTLALSDLERLSRVTVGARSGDVLGDDDARAFLRRHFGDRVRDALPPPPRRPLSALRALWRRAPPVG